MQLSKIKRTILVILLVTLTLLTVTACSQTKDAGADTPAADNKSSDAVFSVDGVDVKSVSIEMVGETPNFMVVLANTNDADADFDCTKFVLKNADGDVLKADTSIKTLTANQQYSQSAFTMDEGSLKVGDKVEVYFDSTLVDTVTVTEF